MLNNTINMTIDKQKNRVFPVLSIYKCREVCFLEKRMGFNFLMAKEKIMNFASGCFRVVLMCEM